MCSDVIYVGERRRIFFDVTFSSEMEYPVTDARYECRLNSHVLLQGELTINKYELSFFFAPEHAGTYNITIYFTIASEKVVKKFILNVLP